MFLSKQINLLICHADIDKALGYVRPKVKVSCKPKRRYTSIHV